MMSILFSSDPDYYGEDAFEFYMIPMFDFMYEDSWFTNELAIKMIKDIDNCTVISERKIECPIFGDKVPRDFSSGLKMLLLVLFYDNKNGKVYNGAHMGDNCYKWLLEIAKIRDFTVRVCDYIRLDIDAIEGGNSLVTVLNDGINKVVQSNDEYVELMRYWVYETRKRVEV